MIAPVRSDLRSNRGAPEDFPLTARKEGRARLDLGGGITIDLRSTYASIPIKNPFIVSSAGITATADRMRRAEDAGAAAVVMKSLFENPVPRSGDPSPHMRVLRDRMGPLSAGSFYSYEQASHFDEYRYAEEIQKAKGSLRIPVIANLDCRTPGAWVKYARLVEQAGADAVEVKMCPHGEFHGMPLEEIVALVKAEVAIPVVGKVLPQVDDPVAVYRAVAEARADGIVMFNRLSGLEIDIETMVPVMHGGIAGYGGAWYIHFCLRWIAECHGKAQLPITGSGGVGSGEDIIKYLLAGAQSVEVASLVIFSGYDSIGRVLRGVEEWMERKEVSSLRDITGRAARELRKIENIDRTTMLVAGIDKERCTNCSMCASCCFRGAISGQGEHYSVGPGCEGCGLCVEVCPSRAITLNSR